MRMATKTKLTPKQAAALKAIGPDWGRLKVYVPSTTLLSLQNRGLVEGRNHWAWSIAIKYPYNSVAWEWRLKPSAP